MMEQEFLKNQNDLNPKDEDEDVTHIFFKLILIL